MCAPQLLVISFHVLNNPHFPFFWYTHFSPAFDSSLRSTILIVRLRRFPVFPPFPSDRNFQFGFHQTLSPSPTTSALLHRHRSPIPNPRSTPESTGFLLHPLLHSSPVQRGAHRADRQGLEESSGIRGIGSRPVGGGTGRVLI